MPRGRPPVNPENKKGDYITVRLTEAERQSIDEHAQSKGKKARTWAREVLLAEVRKAS